MSIIKLYWLIEMSIKCITKTVCPASFACPMSQRWTSSAKTPSASPSRPSPCRSCGWGSKRSRCRSSAHAGCSAASGSASSVQSWSQTPRTKIYLFMVLVIGVEGRLLVFLLELTVYFWQHLGPLDLERLHELFLLHSAGETREARLPGEVLLVAESFDFAVAT